MAGIYRSGSYCVPFLDLFRVPLHRDLSQVEHAGFESDNSGASVAAHILVAMVGNQAGKIFDGRRHKVILT